MNHLRRILFAVGSPLPVIMVSVGCAAAPPPNTPATLVAPAPAGATTSAASESQPAPPAPTPAEPKSKSTACDLVCEGTHVVSHPITPAESADQYTQEAVTHADQVLTGMHDDLLACYTTRLRGNPKAHGFLTIDIVIGPTGEVQKVETQGGALLGDAAMACIVNRIQQGRFDPPHGGGTMRLEAPFTLRSVAPDESI
jgi:hypothetical protein